MYITFDAMSSLSNDVPIILYDSTMLTPWRMPKYFYDKSDGKKIGEYSITKIYCYLFYISKRNYKYEFYK